MLNNKPYKLLIKKLTIMKTQIFIAALFFSGLVAAQKKTV
jgi:hypothetical protein